MNKTLITLILLILPIIGFCDTLDYWEVYRNDAVIARFNSASRDLKIEMDRSQIKKGDTLTLRHGDDTPCNNCKIVLFVRDDKMRKLGLTETKKCCGNLSFALTNLVEFGGEIKSKRLDFYYWEKDHNGDATEMQLVFQVVLIDDK